MRRRESERVNDGKRKRWKNKTKSFFFYDFFIISIYYRRNNYLLEKQLFERAFDCIFQNNYHYSNFHRFVDLFCIFHMKPELRNKENQFSLNRVSSCVLNRVVQFQDMNAFKTPRHIMYI